QDAKLHAVRYVDSNGASQYLGAELCELLGLELATSDSVGRLMLPELPVQSNLQIHVSHPRWRSLTLHDQLAADGLLTSATMLPGVPVTIKIRGGDDASSVPDGTLVKVQLTGDERDARIVDQFEVRDGQIQLMAWDVNYQQLALQSKDFLIGPVKISMPFWPLQELDMTESSEREIEMTSWKKVRLTGRVVDQNGVGIAGVDVSACSGPTDLAKEMSTLMQKNASFVNQFRLMNRITPPDFARTNQRGEYRLEVGQAAAFVTAEKEGFRCDVDFVRVPIDGSASVEVEPIVLRKIQTLSGKVVDQQGRPVSGSLVWLLGQRQGRRKVVQTDGLGQFRLSVPSVPANVDQDQTSYLMAMNPFGRDAGLINVDLTNSVGSESLQVVVEPKSSEWLLDPTGRAEKNRGQESELLAAWQKELDHRRAAHPDGLPGNQAPELEGGTWLNTSETKLTDFRGRFVLLDFWYIGCGPCHIEIPELRIAHRSFPSERFSVVGVHTNHQSSASVQSFIEETGIEYPVVVDNRLGEISDAYASLGIASYPSYLLLDPNGKIVLNSSIADGNLRSQKLELIRNAIQAWDWE
ncbi:MAG: redoxin domain-containing protein, partial [Planctomycetota bacterium]